MTKIQLTGDLEISRIVAGLMRLHEWGYSPNELIGWIEKCLEYGVTTFDHADIYGGYENEALFGEVLSLRPDLRDSMQIITKCGIMLRGENRPDTQVKHYDTTRDHIVRSVDQSLENLTIDTIDLLLIHRPDFLMDADDVAAAFNELQSAGKVRYFGVSNFTTSQYKLLQSRVDTPLVTNQVEFSVTHHDPLHDGTFDYLQQHRIKPMAWSPLGGGRIFSPQTDADQRLADTIAAIADEHDVDSDQIALAWVMQHPAWIIPVLGTGKTERIHKAVRAIDIPLTRQQWYRIWEASTGHEVP